MPLCLDLVLGQSNLARGVNHHGGPDQAFDDLAIDQLFTPGAVGEGYAVVLVGQERKVRLKSPVKAASAPGASGEMPRTS